MSTKRTVYLAGKARGEKWELIKYIQGCDFIASDDTDKGHGDFSCYGKNAADKISVSDFLIAYLDTPDSYGSIAEIAWAAAMNKPCYMIVIDPLFPDRFSPDKEFSYEEYISGDMYDAYHFVGSMPNVCSVEVKNKDDALIVFKNICALESPIEHIFYQQVLSFSEVFRNTKAQEKIGNYRVDFLIKGENGVFAIELDGHDYHKTKEQRTHDAQKDRSLIQNGINVLRYTGSEVHKDSWQCVYGLAKILFPSTYKSAS